MCEYTGRHFGASYPDACCIDGMLWDLDSCDEPGGGLSAGGDLPCPACNTEEWLRGAAEDAQDGSYGHSMGRWWCGAMIWRGAIEMATVANPEAARAALAKIGPVTTEEFRVPPGEDGFDPEDLVPTIIHPPTNAA